MIIWGISANSHDAALAVFKCKHITEWLVEPLWPYTNNTYYWPSQKAIQDLEIMFASHSERFSKIKNDPHLHKDLIKYALKWGRPQKIIWYENPYKKILRQFIAGQGWNYKENNIKTYLRKYNINAPISYRNHHSCHAAGGYFTSRFDNATIVCIDAIGEFETLTIWRANESSIKRIYSQSYPHSVGLWYSAMTQRIGLKPNEDEYILMGMAAFGDPHRLRSEIMHDFIKQFPLAHNPKIKFKLNLHKGCQDWRPDLKTKQDMFDIAAATQYIYEQIFNNILEWAKENSSSKNLVLMGGCALNCSANNIAYRHFDDVWIMPSPNDAGSAMGAVLDYYKQHIKWKGAFLGYDIHRPYPIKKLMKDLTSKGIVGVANGRAEFGPRALGNRSLLADPRNLKIKDKVNKIKRRQQFRPFAPVVLAEHASDIFQGEVGPYMQFTAICKYPELYPAIVHIDNTSRVQAVPKNGSGIRELLECWFKETGCPMLLNTSLNIKGKPMVNTLKDAKEFMELYGVNVY